MIGKKIFDLRKENGKTQKEIALYLKISQQANANYESNKREPDIDTLIKIADYFNVSVDYLLGKSENKKQPADENISELDKELIKIMSKLTPAEAVRVRDFVSGLIANREANSSQNQ